VQFLAQSNRQDEKAKTQPLREYKLLKEIESALAAKKLKLIDVPVRELRISGLDAERFLIESNRQREKTKTQRLREYKRLKEIETALAAERKKASQAKPGEKVGTRKVPANLPERKGEARESAARTAGLKPRTAEKGLAVLNRADAGDQKAKEAIEKIDRNELSKDPVARLF
jgi:hypothetical protein